MCFWATFLALLYRNDYGNNFAEKPQGESKAVCLNENEFKHEILELLSFNTLAIK